MRLRLLARASVVAIAFCFLALSRPQRAPALTSNGNLRIAVSGDTHGYNIAGNPALDGHDLLAGVRAVLGKADVYLFNHEGTLISSDDIAAYCRTFSNQSTFSTPPSFAQRIDVPGATVIASLANNHAMDCGQAGLSQTLAAFSAAGIQTVGAGADLAAACRPLEITMNGVQLAFVSYLYEDPAALPDGLAATAGGPGVATFDGCDPQHDIGSLPGAIVIVMLHAHWGSSWQYGVSTQQAAAVADLLSWGANLVVASGPHYPQGVSTGGRLAFMGLGDFMFDPGYDLPVEAQQGMLALVDIERRAITEAWLYPTALDDDGLPVLVRDPAARDFISLVAGLSGSLDGYVLPLSGLALVRPGSTDTRVSFIKSMRPKRASLDRLD